ncbi:MAG: hypothetical protein QF886_18455 [Planctomycetota bacterium]|jgi:tetratricopeptide (TPR) repeat protein|nr:hypothetical protein [Planctomycetota bacterium]
MKARILNSIEKRDVLYSGRTSAQDLSSYGHAYRDEGQLSDALEFYIQAEDMSGIDNIKADAIKHGDSFLLRRILRFDPDSVSANEWGELGHNARTSEKYRDALEAFTQAGDERKRKEVLKELGVEDEGEDEEEDEGGDDA